MNRRTFLASAAAGASTVGTAGCARPVGSDTETKTPPKIDQQTPTSGVVPSLPVSEVKSVTESAIESAPSSVADLDAFEAALTNAGVSDVGLTEHDKFLSLSHAVSHDAAGSVARTLGTTAGVYAALVETSGDDRPLSVSVSVAGEVAGEYAVPPEWATEYRTGETTAKEYGEKVLGTVKTKVEPS